MKDYKVKEINALSRGIDVLNALTSLHAASLHELHRETGIPKSTLTRILYTLAKKGYVWQRVADNAFLPSFNIHKKPFEQRDMNWLVEIASPHMVDLCNRVTWPSVLSVPRLDHMEVIETNLPKSYFDDVQVGPIGYKANMLRSASGRAYLAFCSESEREVVVGRLRNDRSPGHNLAQDAAAFEQILQHTRQRGYATRDDSFGGHYSLERSQQDDRRESLAIPIRFNDRVLGVVNITWKNYVIEKSRAIQQLFPELRRTVDQIERSVENVLDVEELANNMLSA